MPIISSESAIRKATEYLKSIPPELLGEKIEAIRLETIQLFGEEWSVVLSYLVEPSLENPFLKALGSVRRYREIRVNAQDGGITALLSPDNGLRKAA